MPTYLSAAYDSSGSRTPAPRTVARGLDVYDGIEMQVVGIAGGLKLSSHGALPLPCGMSCVQPAARLTGTTRSKRADG